MGFLEKFFKAEHKEIQYPLMLEADAKGIIVPMDQLPDPMFAEGTLGTCFGIEPSVGEVYAPIDGKVIQLSNTLHAIGIEVADGMEILIHVGVDTVKMEGDGFVSKIKIGDQVEKGQLLLTMDVNKIKAAGYHATVITAVINSKEYTNVELVTSGKVQRGSHVLKVSK